MTDSLTTSNPDGSPIVTVHPATEGANGGDPLIQVAIDDLWADILDPDSVVCTWDVTS